VPLKKLPIKFPAAARSARSGSSYLLVLPLHSERTVIKTK